MGGLPSPRLAGTWWRGVKIQRWYFVHLSGIDALDTAILRLFGISNFIAYEPLDMYQEILAVSVALQ
jgi:hypothetical protein